MAPIVPDYLSKAPPTSQLTATAAIDGAVAMSQLKDLLVNKVQTTVQATKKSLKGSQKIV